MNISYSYTHNNSCVLIFIFLDDSVMLGIFSYAHWPFGNFFSLLPIHVFYTFLKQVTHLEYTFKKKHPIWTQFFPSKYQEVIRIIAFFKFKIMQNKYTEHSSWTNIIKLLKRKYLNTKKKHRIQKSHGV